MTEAKNVVKSSDGFRTLDGSTTMVPHGPIYGPVDLDGVDKSALLHYVTGVHRQDSDSVLIEGNPVYENPAAKSRITSIPGELYCFLSASTWDMMCSCRGFHPWSGAKCYRALEGMFTITPGEQPIRRLFKGMQKQPAFWLVLYYQPDILVLGESVDGLGPVIQRQVWPLLTRGVADHGTTVLIFSHNPRELEDMCDHVGILSGGKVLIERSLSTLQESVIKMQVVLQERKLPQPSRDLQVFYVSQVERIRTLVIRGNTTEITNRLAVLVPILMEALPLTLEKIFIHELRGEDHVVRDIVL